MKTSPDVSLIISTFNRPELLARCLQCLLVQTHRDFEVLITDNATDDAVAASHKATVLSLQDKRFRYARTAGKLQVSDCYWSAEWGVQHTTGRWLVFPCDDTMYVDQFLQRMLGAAYANAWEYVVCSMPVVGPAASGGTGEDFLGGGCGYRLWNSSKGRAIKTTFMVKRSVFSGFPHKPTRPMAANADYEFGRVMESSGIRCGRVPEILVIHN